MREYFYVYILATRKDGPYRAECGAKVDVVDGDWPPEGGDEHACPVCVRSRTCCRGGSSRSPA